MKVVNYTRPTTDGRIACENDELAFWQSRMTTMGNRADVPALTDLNELARGIRHCYEFTTATAAATAAAAITVDPELATAIAWSA